MRPVDTTIVIVSYNSRELTLRAVAAAREAAVGLDAVIVVADNGSDDGTPEAVRSVFPGLAVAVYPDNPGYGTALNRAFAAFPAGFLCALNADVLLGAGSLPLLRQFLDQHPEIGLVGPALMDIRGQPQASCKRFPTLGFALAEMSALHALFPRNSWVQGFYYAGQDLSRPVEVETISGSTMLIRAEAFQRIGGFDQGFRMYFEETDLCRRLRDAGHGVAFCPQATAVHWHGASTLQTSVRQVEYYLSYVRYFRKHHGSGPALVLAAAVAVSTVLRLLALLFKYPPLSRRSRTILRPKLSACWRLLGDLFRPAIRRTVREVRQ